MFGDLLIGDVPFWGGDSGLLLRSPRASGTTSATTGRSTRSAGQLGARGYLLASLDESLDRLGLDHVDIFYSHRIDPMTPLEETVGALDDAVRAGKPRGHLRCPRQPRLHRR